MTRAEARITLESVTKFDMVFRHQPPDVFAFHFVFVRSSARRMAGYYRDRGRAIAPKPFTLPRLPET